MVLGQLVIDGGTAISLATLASVVVAATAGAWKSSRWVASIELKLVHLHECVEALKKEAG